MTALQASDRAEFLPPPETGRGPALGLALLAHALLAAALAWGVAWTRDNTSLSAEAELWAATPQQAAPPLTAPPPPPPPPPPAPAPRLAPPPPAPVKNADIAIEREKKRQQLEADKERERQKKEKALAEKKAAEKKLAEQKEAERQRQRQDKLQAEKKRLEEEKRRDEADALKVAQLREENLKRLQQGLAGATGAPGASGDALRAAGPSDSYGGRIRARVKPNIIFTEDVAGNPSTEVEVRMAPDGTITSRRITRKSGNPAWDDAVLRALDRTETLPRDVDGRVHSPLLIEFRPKG
jgi:colicin import membrane protein